MLEGLDGLRELSFGAVALRLALAVLFSGLIGMEREKKHCAAGFRTYMLVCLGAALTMILSQYEAHMLGVVWMADPGAGGLQIDISRLGAQVINGIGFLGAGTIIVTGHQEVKGVTTAAGLWASACMGLAIGAGFYECVLPGFLLIFLVMRILPYVETFVVKTARNVTLFVEFDDLDHIGEIIGCIKAQGVQIYAVDIDHGREELGKNPGAVFTIRMQPRQSHAPLLASVWALDSVRAIDEM